jgi:hypothetical protein
MYDFDGTHEFDCPGPANVLLRAGAGEVNVTAEARTSAVVELSALDDSEASHNAVNDTLVEMHGERLVIETPESRSGGWLFRRGPRLRVDVRVPLDSRLQARVGSADVRCDGRLADVSLNTGSGDLTLAHTVGELSVNSGSGDVRADHVGGTLRVKSASGDVDVQTVAGDASLHSASGDVHLRSTVGSVRVTTASGDVRLGTVLGDSVKANSASGDVIVGVPTGTTVWLDLHTMSGDTDSDLAIGPQPPAGGAKLSLQVRTMSGDIRVQRVNASSTAAGRPTLD